MKVALIALLSFTPSFIAAQSISPVPGTRLRIQMAEGNRVAGALSVQTADSIVLIGSDLIRIAVPTASVTSMQVGAGRSHGLGALRGMGYGAAWVGGAMVVAGLIAGGPEGALFFGAMGGLTGALYGAGIGAIVGAERWTTIQPNAPRVSVGTLPSGGTRVGLSFSF